MKIICELRSEELFEGRSSQLYTQLMQLGKESLEKIQACMEFEPLTSAIPVQRSTNKANRRVHYGKSFYSGKFSLVHVQTIFVKRRSRELSSQMAAKILKHELKNFIFKIS